jgi:hypothetical protein
MTEIGEEKMLHILKAGRNMSDQWVKMHPSFMQFQVVAF